MKTKKPNYRSRASRGHLREMFFKTCLKFEINPISPCGLDLYREILPENTLQIIASTGKVLDDAALSKRIRLNLIKTYSHLFDLDELKNELK